ncbi:methyltransferase domain-containing protein [Amycolatopsis tucumanensis]|uniref:methyltransferase domain-containing protein n=1 Tax=Amycolatopsis tucumanensis TaxID=401106 RepID=UPI003D74EF61
MTEPVSQQRLRLRDEFLGRAADELFKYDERLRGLDLEVRFDRGVAHLTGEVGERAHLDTARELIGRLDGVFGVWDRVRVGGRDPLILDLGCGGQKQYPGNLGVDLMTTGEVDVVADLSGPLPFADSCADRVFLVHILEHLIDFLPLVDEVHRVLRPDGIAYVVALRERGRRPDARADAGRADDQGHLPQARLAAHLVPAARGLRRGQHLRRAAAGQGRFGGGAGRGAPRPVLRLVT